LRETNVQTGYILSLKRCVAMSTGTTDGKLVLGRGVEIGGNDVGRDRNGIAGGFVTAKGQASADGRWCSFLNSGSGQLVPGRNPHPLRFHVGDAAKLDRDVPRSAADQGGRWGPGPQGGKIAGLLQGQAETRWSI